jgi:hypothetical protein
MDDPQEPRIIIRRTIVVHDQPSRGWLRAIWRYVWHYRDPGLGEALLKLACILFTADSAAIGGEVASDVTGIGILDNVLLVLELPAEVLLFIFIIFRLVWAWKKIRDCRYN